MLNLGLAVENCKRLPPKTGTWLVEDGHGHTVAELASRRGMLYNEGSVRMAGHLDVH